MNEKKDLFKKLDDKEEFVIVHKGTERPFTGKYENFYEKGIYVCKRCGLPLYRSDDKFKSECGWPSFDDEIPGAVKKQIDDDGVRTEITCSYCGAHLGHIFEGERYTSKNVRHCVNSISMEFIPDGKKIERDRAFFAAGCFWGVEYMFKTFKGVIDTRVGYMGGKRTNPTYEQVCTGTTGHAETTEVIYKPDEITYEMLVRFFFELHDFSQMNRQGPDIGEQYRSVIFYTNDSQRSIAEKIKKELEEMGKIVATQIVKASDFWPAEEYHQNYYEKTGKVPYCHYRREIFPPNVFKIKGE
jgi:peptide methionine sulfoxide reductase msrA/msrB